MKPKRVVVLGATGSIGVQTLDCIRKANEDFPGRYEVVGLSARKSLKALTLLSKEWPLAFLAGPPGLDLEDRRVLGGANPFPELLDRSQPDIIVNGIAGSAGLSASLAALDTGATLALANKESIVMAYRLLADTAARSGSQIIPVDSEHAALFQLTRRIGKKSIAELTITASGGPFRSKPIEELKKIQPDEAATHPVWKMGRKISIDSATLANKGLELIEAARLFSMPTEKIRVLVHPESFVHALIRSIDGSLYANISKPDMRLPIDIALNWPDEVPCAFGSLDLAGRAMSFFDPEPERYPMLSLARLALELGEAGTIAYNAADEVAVRAFEDGTIGYTQIPLVVEKTLTGCNDWDIPIDNVDSIFYCDDLARKQAGAAVMEIEC
jgi:1-deoxy-D-xylulose-5-phosphate reductoisomerase